MATPIKHTRPGSHSRFGTYDYEDSGYEDLRPFYHRPPNFYHGDSRRSQTCWGDYDHNTKHRNVRQAKVYFEDAAKRLFRSLHIAVRFYSHFEKEFARDTSGVMPYAGEDIIEALWIRKVKKSSKDVGKKAKPVDTSDTPTSQRTDAESSNEGGRGTNFRDLETRLLEEFDTILRIARSRSFNSQINGRRRSERERIHRLMETLERKSQQIKGSLYEVKKRPDWIRELIKDAEIARDSLKKTKDLWEDWSDFNEAEYDTGSRPYGGGTNSDHYDGENASSQVFEDSIENDLESLGGMM